jgi:SAM-dependent methyltransferase
LEGGARCAAMLPLAKLVCVMLLPPSARRSTVPRLSASDISGSPDVRILGADQSRELLTFERMVKVKPYPAQCPYDGLELFSSAEPLRLQPPPSRVVSAAIQRLYRQQLGWRPQAILEHVCDGKTRLPPAQRRRAGQAQQLHHTGASLAAALRTNTRHLQHAALPALQLPTAGADGPRYSLPFADGTFDAVVSHQCVPYTVAPLPLFAELHRVLRPKGRVVVTFAGPPPSGSSSRWAKVAPLQPRPPTTPHQPRPSKHARRGGHSAHGALSSADAECARRSVLSPACRSTPRAIRSLRASRGSRLLTRPICSTWSAPSSSTLADGRRSRRAAHASAARARARKRVASALRSRAYAAIIRAVLPPA